MKGEWLVLIKLSFFFLLLFGMGEVLYHFLKVKAEYTRKLIHAGTGILTLLFPLYLQHLWQVIIICFAFLVLLLCSLRFRFLPSINNVNRSTWGSILYPLIVILVFAFYQWMQTKEPIYHPYLYFYSPVLVMAICDPLAALSGIAYKKKHRLANGKTNAGSLAFLGSAFLLSLLLFFLFSQNGAITATDVLYSFVIALCGAFAERFSNKGWDNFTIPLMVMLILFVGNRFAFS